MTTTNFSTTQLALLAAAAVVVAPVISSAGTILATLHSPLLALGLLLLLTAGLVLLCGWSIRRYFPADKPEKPTD
jgi:hypothetical protein